jgi:Protein of unknown function (DUF4199)
MIKKTQLVRKYQLRFLFYKKVLSLRPNFDFLKQTMKELFIKMSRTAATVALVAGIFYGWIFRLTVVASVTWAMIIFKKRNHFLMSIRQGLSVGLLTSLFIGSTISLNTFAMREYIYPTYNEDLKNIYRGNLSREKDIDNPDKLKWKPEQIETQLNQRWATFFTTKGGMAIDMFGAIAVGFMTSATVCFMLRRVKN